jgi:hypothetical protein
LFCFRVNRTENLPIRSLATNVTQKFSMTKNHSVGTNFKERRTASIFRLKGYDGYSHKPQQSLDL